MRRPGASSALRRVRPTHRGTGRRKFLRRCAGWQGLRGQTHKSCSYRRGCMPPFRPASAARSRLLAKLPGLLPAPPPPWLCWPPRRPASTAFSRLFAKLPGLPAPGTRGVLRVSVFSSMGLSFRYPGTATATPDTCRIQGVSQRSTRKLIFGRACGPCPTAARQPSSLLRVPLPHDSIGFVTGGGTAMPARIRKTTNWSCAPCGLTGRNRRLAPG
jgi:hypothetical protein